MNKNFIFSVLCIGLSSATPICGSYAGYMHSEASGRPINGRDGDRGNGTSNGQNGQNGQNGGNGGNGGSSDLGNGGNGGNGGDVD